MIRNILHKIKSKIMVMLTILKIIIKSIYKKRVYIFGIPIHGNLGDHAILEAEKKFLFDNFKEYKIIEVESSIIRNYFKILKIFVGKSVIFINGGGFLGSLWIDEEIMFRTTLINFPNNNVIVFPQTVYFSKDEKECLETSKNIYCNHNNLYICCREKYSYEFMRKEFPTCNILLVPDMVLYMEQEDSENKRENALFCIRKDKEKVKYDFSELRRIFEKNNIKIDETDTVINKIIYSNRRQKYLKNKLREFSNHKIVVTDRLHGMVFAYLTKTPCIVFENSSYKVKGLYEWISNSEYIQLYNSQNFEEVTSKFLKKDYSENNINLKNKYIPLLNIISKSFIEKGKE